MRVSKVWGIVFALTLAALASAWLRTRVASGAREAFYPFANATAWFRGHVLVRVSGLVAGGRLAMRVRELEGELARLRLDLARTENLAGENRELRQQLQFVAHAPERLVACQVLSRDGTTGWWRQIRLGKGSRQGLAAGQAVLTGDGLVGRVTTVSPGSAEALLITDPNSRLACELDPPPPGLDSVRGILYGGGVRAGANAPELLHVLEPLRLRYLARDAQPAPRTRVLTSGLGGSLPAGLTVGYLLDSEVDAGGLYRVGEVVPAADLTTLATVFVLVGGGP